MSDIHTRDAVIIPDSMAGLLSALRTTLRKMKELLPDE